MDRYTQESTHGRTKRHQRQLAEFEALQAEGNPNDCHTQKQSERSSQQRQTPAENQQPKNICKESADGRAAEHDFLPEREKRQSGKLKHCSPSGMPMTVMQKSSPLKNHETANTSPAIRNQRTFPKTRISALGVRL